MVKYVSSRPVASMILAILHMCIFQLRRTQSEIQDQLEAGGQPSSESFTRKRSGQGSAGYISAADRISSADNFE
ncbi:hypothetical protein EVAR_101584_1 [Eumeta japonica]|uniref:Uncharacterized protein n=1 Tax=Eumeta variegata TaxID=151549 RepID=A0A4C1SVU4_EUMVA|nr:hypothetical protein EVAR_101584_1 [Eumeta japonica]